MSSGVQNFSDSFLNPLNGKSEELEMFVYCSTRSLRRSDL